MQETGELAREIRVVAEQCCPEHGMRVYVEQLPPRALIARAFVEGSDPDYVQWDGNPDDGYDVTLIFENGTAVYHVRTQDASQDEFWGRLTDWRPR